VFYCEEMVADSESYSPSAEKPRAVVASWRQALPIEVIAPTPVTVEDLSRAHDERFVRAVLSSEAPNGFGNRSRKVAASLPFTSGAMLSAARHAIRHGSAAAPCSGFHHAGFRSAGGFCTFNGLMVAACVLRAEGAKTIGILDCDHHYGDGTDDIIEAIGAESWIRHQTIGARWSTPEHAGRFLAALPSIVESMRGCDVLLYQAGADPHIHDPLGGWLTTDELRQRDAIVFGRARDLGIPIAWNLAGGYQRDRTGTLAPIVEIHLNTAREWIRAYVPAT
jgi:acetoin utilization deacetylase AcuC-like enzyme